VCGGMDISVPTPGSTPLSFRPLIYACNEAFHVVARVLCVRGLCARPFGHVGGRGGVEGGYG
jgi:hypothetical protein